MIFTHSLSSSSLPVVTLSLVVPLRYLYKERNTSGRTLIRSFQFSVGTAVGLYKVKDSMPPPSLSPSLHTLTLLHFTTEPAAFGYCCYLSPPVSVRPGSVCKICRICVHTKCQLSVPYCSGVSQTDNALLSKVSTAAFSLVTIVLLQEAPTPKSPRLSRMNLKKVYKKMKGGGGGAAFAPGEISY